MIDNVSHSPQRSMRIELSCESQTSDTGGQDHEAVPGDKITDVQARVRLGTPYKPNVVIINAGTSKS